MNPASEFPAPKDGLKISHQQPVVLIGSCFSEHIAVELQQAGFHVVSNPFGVIFHPIPLARCLSETLTETTNERTLQRDDVFLSWDASSEVYAMSESDLKSKLHNLRSELKMALSQASVLVITLGSAHGYRLNDEGTIVANCHKMPGSRFKKELTPLDELAEHWEETISALKIFNPELQLIFTVSPVRYSRDGWTENNRSKARLFELCGVLEERFGVTYFPAYELVNDLLRDYRYFARDGVHPNELAVEEVWNLFSNWFFKEATVGLIGEMAALRRMEQHRLLFPESEASKRFLEQFQQQKDRFLLQHPYIRW